MNPILLVKDAGLGETPPCPDAQFEPGDVVRVSRGKSTIHFPAELVVAVAVPPGFPAAYALADLLGEPRPLMISKPSAQRSYILVREGDPAPYHCPELKLRPTGRKVEIGSIRREGDAG